MRTAVIACLVNIAAFASAAAMLATQRVDRDAPAVQDSAALRDSLRASPPSEDLWDWLAPEFLRPATPRQQDDARPRGERCRCRCSCATRGRRTKAVPL